MSRNKPVHSLMQQKPRKMLKIDTINQKCYNEFQGNSDEQIQVQMNQQRHTDPNKQYNSNIDAMVNKKLSIDEQVNQNQKIFQLISKQNIKYKKINGGALVLKKEGAVKIQKSHERIKKQQAALTLVKLEQGRESIQIVPIQQKPKTKTKQKVKAKSDQIPSSNWKKFLQDQSNNQSKNGSKSKGNQLNGKSITPFKQASKFVAMDCQFVKCEQQDQLARISIVSEDGKTLYDSYIKPSKKVTDYVTDITGITFSHVKNAPLWTQQIAKVKKILLGKILVGHTIHKDLEVTKLTAWKGISQKIDIAEFSQYKQKGGSKIVGLKKLTTSLLDRNIQAGWHSSVQDAVATMDLFKINKKKILKELKFI